MTRYLGIDYGSKRIGLAVGDDATRLASPLATVEIGGGLAEQVHAVSSYVNDYDVHALVVGLPLNMDDSEGPQAAITRRFGDQLARGLGLPVFYFDERLSSCAADELLRPAELTRKKKKKRLDRVAAQVMLQGFLDARAENAAFPTPPLLSHDDQSSSQTT